MGQTREQMLVEALARVSAPGELVQAVAEALGVPESVAEYALGEVLDENLFGLAAAMAATNAINTSRRRGGRGRGRSAREINASLDRQRSRGKKTDRYGWFKSQMRKHGVQKLAGKISSAAKRGMKMVFGKWQKVEAAEMRRELRRLESTSSPFPEARERRMEQLREDLKEWDPGAYKNSAPPAGSIIIDKGSYTGWVSKTGFYLEYDDLDHVLEAKSKQDAAKLYAIVSKDKKAFADIWKHEQHSADPSKRKPGMREWLESKGIDYYFNKGYH